MALVKSQIDIRIATTRGHVIVLKAGIPTDIPEDCVQAAYMRGCVPVSADAPAPTPEVRAQVAEPSDELTVDDVVRMILEEGDPEKIRFDGIPKVTVVREQVPGVRTEDVADAFARVAPTVESFIAQVNAQE